MAVPYPVASGSSIVNSSTLVLTAGTLQVGSGATGTAAGDAIIVGASLNNATGSGPVSVHDSKGNTYVKAAGLSGNGYDSSIWVAANCAALVSGTDTITITYTSATATDKNAAAVGFTGIGATAAVDAAVSAFNNTGSTAPSVSTGTLAQPSELIIGWSDSGAGSGGITWSAPVTRVISSFQGPSSNQWSGMSYDVVSSTSAVTVAGTITSARWSVLAISLKLPLPVVTTASLPGGTEGIAYSQAVAAAGGFGAYTWSISAGSLPAGLSMSAGGLISGTPTASGTFTFTAEVTDANSNTGTAALAIAVGLPGSSVMQPPAGYGWFSAYPGSGNADPNAAGTTSYESASMANRQLAAWYRYYEVTQAVPTADDKALVAAGRFLVMSLASSYAVPPASGGIGYAAIAAGTYDSYLGAIGSGIAALAQPCFVVWGHEMELASNAGFGTAAQFIASFQHVANVLRAAAPGNVIMCWVCSGGTAGVTEKFYPGDAYVDWLGVDPYDPAETKGGGGEPGSGPLATYTPFVSWLNSNPLSPAGGAGSGGGLGKPYGIFETGVNNPAGSDGTTPVTDANRAAWINAVPAALQALGYQYFAWFNASTSFSSSLITPGSLAGAALATIGASSFFNPPSVLPSTTPYPIGQATPAAGSTAVTTLVINVAETVNAGDGIVVAASVNNNTGILPSSCADSQGNTYTRLANTSTGEYGSAMFYAPCTTSLSPAAPDTITVTYSSAATIGKTAAAVGIPGAKSSGAVDIDVSAVSAGSAAPSVGTGVLAQGAEVVVAFTASGAGGGAIAWGAGMTPQVPGFQAPSSNQWSSMATQVTSSNAGLTVSGTITSARWTILAVSVKLASLPVITTATLPDAYTGSAYSQALSVAGGVAPYTWSITSGSLPAGLSLSSAGLITGTASATGTSSFTAEVTDSASNAATKTLSLIVSNGVTVTTTSLPGGTTGVPYSASLAATGGAAPYTWSVSSGSLPAGLSLSSGGVFSGTPQTAATTSFTVEATDADSNTATQPLSVTVTSNLTVTTTSLPQGTIGVPYTASLAAAGGFGAYTWSVSSGSLPGGLSLSGNVISGTPSGAGVTTFTIEATDAGPNTATQVLTITVTGTLTVLTTALLAGTLGVHYTQTLAAAGGVSPYTWAVTNGALPPGLALTASTGVISGTPAASGSYSFTVTVTDSASGTAAGWLGINIPGTVPLTTPLDLDIDLKLGAQWVNISGYTYQREGTSPPVSLTRGRPDESATASPSSCTMQWNNRNGQFSPANPAGSWYGLLGRNTPIRVSVPAQQTYLRLADDTTSYISCPDTTALHLTGNFDVRADIQPDSYLPCVIAAKWGSAATAWGLVLNADGTLTWYWYDGTNTNTARSAQPIGLGRVAVRVLFQPVTQATVTFYTAPTMAGTFTQLGNAIAITSGDTAVSGAGQPVQIGWSQILAAATGYGGYTGQVYEVQILNASAVLAADPVFTAQTAGTTSFTDAQSNTWTTAGTCELSGRSYRGHFECSSLPQQWDPSGTDVWTPVQASGILRRLSQANSPILSAMRRAVTSLTGLAAPLAYWPGEDLAGAQQVASGLPGGTPLVFSAGLPTLASSSAFACSASLPVLKGSAWTAPVPPSSSGAVVLSFLLAVPSGGDTSGSPTVAQLATTGTAEKILVIYNSAGPGGSLWAAGTDANGAVLWATSTSAITNVNGALLLVQVSVRNNGSGGTIYEIEALAAGTTIPQAVTGSFGSSSAGMATRVFINPGTTGTPLSSSAAGHIFAQAFHADISALAQPLAAWAGETAGTRFARLCAEYNITPRVYGYPAASVVMGAQAIDTLANVLQACEDTDHGQMYEPRQVLGIAYRTVNSMCAQPVPVTLNYAAFQTGDGTQPIGVTDDDQYTVNDWTITNSNGSSLELALNDGSAMSVSPPPAGAGDYASSKTLYLGSDAQLPDAAGWMLHVSTCPGERYPLIPLNLARPALTALLYAIQGLNIGDYIEITNPPAWMPPGPIRQIICGVTEQLGGLFWKMGWQCVPESPYEVLVASDPVRGRADTSGSSLAAAVSATATSLSAATASGNRLWTTAAADFPFSIVIGGEEMTVTSITGTSSPQTFTVTRSVNGVVKAQLSGAAVSLCQPVVLALA